MIIKPQAGPQEKFLSCSASICIYGGAAGGGKSYGLLMDPLRYMGNPGYRAVIFRRDYTQISSSGGLWDESQEMYGQIKGTTYAKYPKFKWTFKSGATVGFDYLRRDSDLIRWQGSQITFIGFDELTHFTERQFFFMLSRNRSTCGIKPYIRATCNPDCDSWVAKFISWWIDPETGYPIPERSGKIRYMGRKADKIVWADTSKDLVEQGISTRSIKRVMFIASTLADNKILMEKDPSYEANLEALPTVERERLLKGNWKIKPAAGMYFRRSDFTVVTEIPKNVVRWCRAWDIAATEPEEGKDPDSTSGTLMGVTSDRKYIIVGRINERIRAGKVESLIFNTALSDRAAYGFMYRVHVPQDPGAAGKIVANNYIELLQGFDVRTDPVTGSKIQRALPFAAQCQHGNVMILAGAWNEAYLSQLESFPESAHDDDVDSSSDAFNDLSGDKFNLENLL